MLPVEVPFKIYNDLNGHPINNGYVYFGVAGMNPITNPVTVFWDAAGTIPALQPLRTVNGYIMRAGTPANVFFSGAYSELVQDAQQRQIFYAQTSEDFSISTIVSNFITGLTASSGASMIGYPNGGTPITVEKALDILYYGVKNPMNPKYAGGAVGNGIAIDYAALSACYADTSSPYVNIPSGKTFLVNSSVSVPSGTITIGSGTIKGTGTVGLFSLSYPSTGTIFDGLTLDGNKTSGTTDVVTLIYAPGSTISPTIKSKNLVVRNCTLRNGSAGIAFENAIECNVHNNHISAMFRHTTGPYSGSYGYGIVFNGCQNSQIHSNQAIGTADAPIERHGIYMPVFLDNQATPSFLNFCSSIQIYGNRVSVRHDPVNEPFSSCVESWNYFDISICNNHLIGGVRGINSTPEYQNGSRVQIIGNLIKDSEICIRNDRATKGAAPGTYYFDEYQIDGNTLLPLSSVVSHQAVFLQGVKKILFHDNYCKGNASNTFAFGYYDVAFNNLAAELISSSGNVIAGFLQGFYLANVNKFTDDSSFELFTGAPLPYVRVANIGASEMRPNLSPLTSLYAYNTGDWAGVSYYEAALDKTIRNNGSYWVDAKGIRVRGPTVNRPNNVSVIGGTASPAEGIFTGLEYGFKYYDETAMAMLYWNGVAWDISQRPAPPLSATTADLNTFKVTYPAALGYGAMSWNTTTSKPVFFNANTLNWVYADGTVI